MAVPVTTPSPGPAATLPPASASVHAHELPFDTPLVFVLDGAISSNGSKPGDRIPAHLKSPIIVGGHILAPAGTPCLIRILGAESAQSGDVYGFVDVYFEPITLVGGVSLPLRSPTTRLSVRLTAGHASTVGIEDNIEDAVIPFHSIYHVFRKGPNFVLEPGAELPARTQAIVSLAQSGLPVISTPAPIAIGLQVPHSSFSVMPMATPGRYQERPTPPPTPKPSASPAPSISPSTAPVSTPLNSVSPSPPAR